MQVKLSICCCSQAFIVRQFEIGVLLQNFTIIEFNNLKFQCQSFRYCQVTSKSFESVVACVHIAVESSFVD